MAPLSSGDGGQDHWGQDALYRFGEALPIFITLITPIICVLICVFNQCFGCLRKSNAKEEMFGVEGRITISSFTNQQNNSTVTQPPSVNFHNSESDPSLTISSTNNIVSLIPQTVIKESSPLSILENNKSYASSDNDLTGSLKRATNRQLPDLPQIPLSQQLNPPRRTSSLLSHDGTSELYATVGDIDPKPSTSRNFNQTRSIKDNQNEPPPSEDSETYAIGESSHHAYAKLKRNPHEHPYAKVRKQNEPAEGGDETDTDNYDTPQPYAQTSAGRQNNGSFNNDTTGHRRADDSHAERDQSDENLNENIDIPPRRPGRHYPGRNSQPPQPQPPIDNQSNFSGDSQDSQSRGYTSISVREPLENIRVQTTKRIDPNYATVSDDSEEMYAAIDDAENNYMRIDENDSKWIGSPIPERREANSPLPPPPPTHLSLDSPNCENLNLDPNHPVYAQVVKKPKKGISPLATSGITSSTSQTIFSTDTNTNLPSTSSSSSFIKAIDNQQKKQQSNEPSTSSKSHFSNKNRHTISADNNISGNSSNVNLPNKSNIDQNPAAGESRRWSKADISYSEFEIVREAMTNQNSSSSNENSPINEMENIYNPSTSTNVNILLDDENYDIIPEKNVPVYSISAKKKLKAPQPPTSTSTNSASNTNNYKPKPNWKSFPKSTVDNNSDSRYQLEEDSYNTYQEIDQVISSKTDTSKTNHYQEIDESQKRKRLEKERFANRVYQEIGKVYEIDDNDEEDEFYEQVRPVIKSSSSNTNRNEMFEDGKNVDSSSEGKMLHIHGYEKLRKKDDGSKKGIPPPPPKIVDDDEEDDDDDDDDEEEKIDEIYEKVKYPPYERLKESRESIKDDLNHIYSKPSKNENRRSKSAENNLSIENAFSEVESITEIALSDLNQLYAQVDKKTKRRPITDTNTNTTIGTLDLEDALNLNTTINQVIPNQNNNLHLMSSASSSKSLSSVQIGENSSSLNSKSSIKVSSDESSKSKSSFIKNSSTLRLDPDVVIEYI